MLKAVSSPCCCRSCCCSHCVLPAEYCEQSECSYYLRERVIDLLTERWLLWEGEGQDNATPNSGALALHYAAAR